MNIRAECQRFVAALRFSRAKRRYREKDKMNPLCVKIFLIANLVRDCWAARVPVSSLSEINQLSQWWLSYLPGIATGLDEL